MGDGPQDNLPAPLFVDKQGRARKGTTPTFDAGMRDDVELPAEERERRKLARFEHAKVVAEREDEPKEIEDLIKVGDGDMSQYEVYDVRISKVQRWVGRGYNDPEELEKLTKIPANVIAEKILPAVYRRLAEGITPAERSRQLRLAIERESDIIRFAWQEIGATDKVAIKAQLLQVIQNANRSLMRLYGLAGKQKETKVYIIAIHGFIDEVARLVSDTNDAALMQRMEKIIEKFLHLAAKPKGEVVDAEFTELPGSD